jgi:nucleoside-diphosphate-sugar epimerase
MRAQVKEIQGYMMNTTGQFTVPRKVLVTGASGKIGSAVVRALHAEGFEVRATDRHRFRDLPVRIEVADLRDPIACYELADGMEAVVHLGNHPNLFAADPQTVYAENLRMNVNVFQAAGESGV